MPSVDNASRREPPLVTAGRMGLLEAGALLVTHGADLEARDGQGRTALWHAVREGGLQKLCGQNLRFLPHSSSDTVQSIYFGIEVRI